MEMDTMIEEELKKLCIQKAQEWERIHGVRIPPLHIWRFALDYDNPPLDRLHTFTDFLLNLRYETYSTKKTED